MTCIIGTFVLEFEDAYTWASKHAPDEMDLEDKSLSFGRPNRSVFQEERNASTGIWHLCWGGPQNRQ